MGGCRKLVVAALVALVASTAVARAQPRASRPPTNAWQFRLGWFFPSGDSDFWQETEDVFTLKASDFDSFGLGFTYVRSVSNNLEIGINIDFYEDVRRSSYRDFVDMAGFPILHDTELSLIPITVDLRYMLGGRYRIRPGGRFVLKPAYYVGAGLGFTSWEYRETGDFLDFTFDPPVIFGASFRDDGTAFETHLLAGVELPFGGHWTSGVFEARYSFAKDDLGGDFAGLGELDVGGFSIYGGGSFRF